MEITYRCPACQASNRIDPAETPDGAACQACGQSVALTPSASILDLNVVDVCPRCGQAAFYVQRDFNQRLGLGIVILFALIGLAFVWLDRPLYFYVCLGAGALLDLLLYALLPEITVCYACKTAFRNVDKNPAHKPFDLHIADVYDNRSMG